MKLIRVVCIALAVPLIVMLLVGDVVISADRGADLRQDWLTGRAVLHRQDPYRPLAEIAREHPGAGGEKEAVHLYAHVASPHPPAHVLFLAPLSDLSFTAMRIVWLFISLAALVLALLIFTRRHNLSRWYLLGALLLPIVHMELLFGQTACLLLLIVVLAETRPWLTGLAAALKVHPALLLLRLRGRQLLAAVGIVAVSSLIAVSVIGPAACWRWATSVTAQNVSYWRGSSLNLGGAATLTHIGVPFAVGSLLVLIAAIFAVRRTDYWSAMAWIVLVSPLSWPHYAVLCLPAFMRRRRMGLIALVGLSWAATDWASGIAGGIGLLAFAVLDPMLWRRKQVPEEFENQEG